MSSRFRTGGTAKGAGAGVRRYGRSFRDEKRRTKRRRLQKMEKKAKESNHGKKKMNNKNI